MDKVFGGINCLFGGEKMTEIFGFQGKMERF